MIRKKFSKAIIVALCSLLPAASIAANTSTTMAEQQTAEYFNKIKSNPLELYMFVQNMPKGADLHNHLSGATYAENLIDYAKADDFCINPTDFTVVINPTCPVAYRLANAKANPDFYRSILEHWSLLYFKPGDYQQYADETHFFDSFFQFGVIVGKHLGEVLSEVVNRAGSEHVSYLELMLTPYDLNLVDANGNELAAALGARIGWENNLADLRQKLLANGLDNIVAQIPPRLDNAEKTLQQRLACGTTNAQPGCQVQVRYLYLALRELPPAQFFAELLTAFEAAKHDPRIVGINVVQAEDGPLAVQDYTLQMHMVSFLHQLYPQVHITLHAGELAPGSVNPEVLRFHIRQAVEIAGAERIGHGADVAYEDNPEQLLNEMATKHIAVEECQTSNALLLGLTPATNPLPLYLAHGVPVVLATDDEAVLRTDLNLEYQRAVLNFHLSYPTLKMLARNSITYAFLPGQSLWQNPVTALPVAVCQHDSLGNSKPSATCQNFLQHSPKAQLQWQLEEQFNKFEQKY